MFNNYKYFAFISYNTKDTEWGKKVQRKLEHYRMPATLCSERGWKRTPIKPVFFAPTDIQPGDLTEELQDRLRSSRNLIVICSPNSAKSVWVGKEIEFFHNIGRSKDIHFFIVDGIPHSLNPDTECFNPVVDRLGLPEILGANIHEQVYRWPWLNRERAYVQLVSKLLGVEFDAIWQRHKRQLTYRFLAFIIFMTMVLTMIYGVWITNQPVDVVTRLQETSVRNDNLPPLSDAVVTITLDNEIKQDTIKTLDAQVIFNNIPHHYLGKKARFTVSCHDFINTDTIVILSKDVVLNVKRDPSVYGNVCVRLFNYDKDEFVSNILLNIGGFEVLTDENGMASLFIPLESQNKVYRIIAPFSLDNDSLIMPCGENDVILMK